MDYKHRTLHRRSGTEHLYTLQDGEEWAVSLDGRIIVIHPDRVPKVIHIDGSEEPLGITDGL